jgi:transmembrane sensor
MKRGEDRDALAAHWYLRLREPDVGADDIDAAFAWLDAAPENQRAFDRVERFWRSGDAAAAEYRASNARVSGAARGPTRGLFAPRSQAWRVAAMIVVAVVAALGLTMAAVQAPADFLMRYHTAVGEIRTVTMPDGSQLTLGGATRVAVNYSRASRRLELAEGEALFKVAKNPQRPFLVEAGGGTARAVGTVFNVHRGAEGVTVAVAEGIVQVQRVGAAGVDTVQLRVGNEVTYSAAGLRPVRNVDPGRVSSWRAGVMSFVNRPLGLVVDDLNRYSRRHIAIDDDSIRALRVTGSVAINGIDEWLLALRETAGIEVAQAGGNLLLRRVAGAAQRAGARP